MEVCTNGIDLLLWNATLSLLYGGGSDYQRGRCCTLAVGKAAIVMPSHCHCRAGSGAGGRCAGGEAVVIAID